MIETAGVKGLEKEEINRKMEMVVRKKLTNLDRVGEDEVYTMGLGVSYSEMLKLMLISEENEKDTADRPIYVVAGSEGSAEVSGFVYAGAEEEKMFFGLLNGEATKRSYLLSDVGEVSKNQKWCVGRIIFSDDKTEVDREEAFCSLIRSCIVFFQKAQKRERLHLMETWRFPSEGVC